MKTNGLRPVGQYEIDYSICIISFTEINVKEKYAEIRYAIAIFLLQN